MAKKKTNIPDPVDTPKAATKKKPTTTKKEPTRGVLLVALGHPYFGKYACNLAMSLKATDPNIPIALVHNESSLQHMTIPERNLFDKKITAKPEWYEMHGLTQYIMSKLFLVDMSPFDETLFLDVDMVWHPRRGVGQLMDTLKDLDFTMQNRGVVDLSADNLKPNTSHWCDLNDLKKQYGVKSGTFWNLSSEFIWFKKTTDVKNMFKDAQKHYRTIKVQHMSFAGGVPDELCFALSMLKHTKVTPHRIAYTPIYWHQADNTHKHMELSELYANFWGYSMGGNITTSSAKEFYNNLAKYYARQLGLSNPFKAKDKRGFVIDRTTI